MCFERIKGLAVAIHAVQDEWRVEETARATLTLKPAFKQFKDQRF
jgi:hypothetical protein